MHLDEVRLQLLCDGEAPAAHEAAHLASCEACRTELAAYRSLAEVLSTLRPAPPPAGFTATVMQRIDARRGVVRRQLAVAVAVPFAALGAFAVFAREAVVLSVASGARVVTEGVTIVSRVVALFSPFVSAWGPQLALAFVCLVAASIPVVRFAMEVSMRPRSRSVVSALLLTLSIPGLADAQATTAPAARSPRLEGEWPAEERRVTLDLDAARPEEALRKLGDAAGWSVIVPPVGGTTTAHLRDVPADAVLVSLLDQWNLRARRSGTLVTIVQSAPAVTAAPALPVLPALPAIPPVLAPEPSGLSDRVATGNDVVIREGERVNDVAIMGGDLDVRGEVFGDAAVVGGDLRVRSTGRIHGDASVAGGDLRVEDGGRIDGMRSAVGAGIAAEAVERLARPGGRGEGGVTGFLSDVFGTLARGIAFFVLGLLLSVFAKDRINVVTEEIKKRPLHSFGTGLVSVFAVPVLTILLCVVVIGIPVVPFLWLGAVLATFAGMTSIALLVGEHLPILEARKTQLVCLAIGAGVFTVIDLIPWIGGIVLFPTALVAFGAVVRTRFAKPNGKASPPGDEFAYRSPA